MGERQKMKRKAVLVVILVLLSAAFLLQAVNIQPVRAQPVPVVGHTMCKGVTASPYDPITPTDTFYVNDYAAYSWVKINGPVTGSHSIEWLWYYPNETEIGEVQRPISPIGVGESDTELSWLLIAGSGSTYEPFLGRNFTTSVFIDNNWAFNETWDVTYPPPPPPPPPRNLVTPPPSSQVDVYRITRWNALNSRSDPMGIADYGIGPNGPYEYATNDSVGIVSINSLSTLPTGMTFQLNVNLAFTTSAGQYVYWIQDVASIDTSSGAIFFADNVWNSSAPSADMSASGISGNGTVANQDGMSWYCDMADLALWKWGNDRLLTYPATIVFNVTSALNSFGQPIVSFAFDDGYGLTTYDTVTFNDVNNLESLTGFEVNGFNYEPNRVTYYDSELILGGPGGGASTSDVQSDVQLLLEYWNGHNYQIVPNAYNFGSDTAEGIDNALSGFSNNPGNGTIFAEIQLGAGQPGPLYSQSQTGVIDITAPGVPSGTLYVSNASDPNATTWQIPFVNGAVNVTLFPGNYLLQLYNQDDKLFYEGNFTVSAGQTLVRTMKIPGDINGDGKVNLADLAALAQAWGSKPGDPNWNPNADLTGSGIVGLKDLVILAQNYGKW
jgi:hypothetical protein